MTSSRCASAALKECRRSTRVFNNAGVARAPPLARDQVWKWVLDVDLNGVIYGLNAFVPVFMEQERGGHVVNTASLAGLGGARAWTLLRGQVRRRGAFGVVFFQELLLMGSNVGVSVLCPGFVKTRIHESHAQHASRTRQLQRRPDLGGDSRHGRGRGERGHRRGRLSPRP